MTAPRTVRVRIVVLASGPQICANAVASFVSEKAAMDNLVEWHGMAHRGEPYALSIIEAEVPLPQVETIVATATEVGGSRE